MCLGPFLYLDVLLLYLSQNLRYKVQSTVQVHVQVQVYTSVTYGFNLPSYTDSIYLPDVSSSSKFKASPFITISPKIKPAKRVPAADFLPLKSETDTDGMASHECGPSAVNLYYEGRLARPSFVKKTPFKPPKKMFLGPELLKK